MSPTFCPVCGYDLALPNTDVLGVECPCCGFDFKYLTRAKTYSYFMMGGGELFVKIHRTVWAEAHLHWCSNTIPQPENWDAIVQFKNIGLDWGNSYAEWADKHPIIIPENKEKFLTIVRERIAELTWQPQFIEALWDGDTQGWFLVIWVSAKRADGKFDKARLLSLRGGGGDFRLFVGTVPPYPEAVIGAFVLEEIAKERGITAYFPGATMPDDYYAGIWERDENYRCITCGKHLLEYAKAQCWTCQRREEQAKKST